MLDAVGIFRDSYRSLPMQLIFGSQPISEARLRWTAMSICYSRPFLLVIGGSLQGPRFAEMVYRPPTGQKWCTHLLAIHVSPLSSFFWRRVNIIGNGEIIVRATI